MGTVKETLRPHEQPIPEASYRAGHQGVLAGAWLADVLRPSLNLRKLAFAAAGKEDADVFVGNPYRPSTQPDPRVGQLPATAQCVNH
jgi:hypothetical protein